MLLFSDKTMSPERSSSPLPPQAVTPRVAKMEVDSGNVQEAEAPRENSYQVTLESNVSATAVTNDDDLTSLSWLQDRNLLKGIFTTLYILITCTPAMQGRVG